MKNSTVLRKAADAIETDGLMAGLRSHYMRSSIRGPMCALGAIGRALYDDPWDNHVDEHPATAALAAKLPPLTEEWAYFTPATTVAQWSNGQTKDAVIAKLRAVAAKLESAE